MERSDYIRTQDDAWRKINKAIDDNDDVDKPLVYEALKQLTALKISVDEGRNVLLYQHAKTLLGIAMCLCCLDDDLDALKVLDELEHLTPSFITPRKDELKRLKNLGRELKKEHFG